ncbi:uncharacterized protein DUF1217 [Azospirillum brasilense]|uniref:Uncharacterized protein DUF1217 n=1 Tax=Azospirillum brasilense TaxID=192 RepID=A0A560AHG2_AZOBR|nr:DUF1217 domain-containing protein [Azospirillum brasilense]TWA59803.1 uncharacterized protein DUF1217 [Azospirillum brasilense]
MSTIQDYRQIVRNQDRFESMIRVRSDVKRNIEYFQENIGKITSAEELLKDEKLYRFVMEAFDLESQIYARALIRKVLDEGVTEPNALANRMNDAKFKELATAMAFPETGGATLKEPAIVQAIVDRYVDVKMEVSAEEKNPAVRLALYFQRKAGRITNWYQVLSDRALQKVVFTAMDIPEQSALGDLDRLVDRMKKRFDIADFQDPAKVQTFLDRFSAMYDLKNGAPAGASASLPYIGPVSRGGRSSIIAIDSSITMSLLNFPRF